MLAPIMTAFGFITAVLPPLLQAANTLTLPPQAQKILATAGIIVFLAGVAKQALAQWQQTQNAHEAALQAADHEHELMLARETKPGIK